MRHCFHLVNLPDIRRLDCMMISVDKRALKVENPHIKHSYKKSSTKKSSSEMIKNVDKVLAACRGQGKVTSVTEVNQGITWASRLGRITDAIEIFRSIESLGYQPDVMSYNNIIWGTGHTGRIDLSKKYFHDLIQSKLKPNVYTYGALIHACGKSKQYQQALVYFDRMIDDGITPNLVVCSEAMEACAAEGMFKEAVSLMQKMETMNIRPDMTMINTAIKACCLGGAMEEAEAFATSMKERNMDMDLFTYHTLMMGHTKLGRHNRVLELYEDAILSGTKLDGGVYSLAMLAALNSGMSGMVPRIADKARGAKVPLTEAAYTILMQAFGEVGAADRALACIDTMMEEGLKPNAISYSAAITACRSFPDKVLTLLNRIKEARRLGLLVPNTVLMTAAIDALARGGGSYSDMAVALLRDMEVNGPEPNIFTYNTIIRTFANGGRLQEALSVLSSIRSHGLMPDRYTFTTLLLACGHSDENNCGAQVTEVMAKMRAAGVLPDEIAYGAAIDAYRRGGSPLQAIECLHDMHKSNLVPSVAHYNLVLRALKAHNMTEMMFKMVMSLSAKEDTRVNSNSFELTLEAMVEEGRWREPLLVIRAMQSLDFKPSVQICVRLVQILEAAKQYKAALALYRVMDQDGVDFYENDILNGVFKRLVRTVAGSVAADLSETATRLVSEVPEQLISGTGIRDTYPTLADLSGAMLNMQPTKQ